MGQLTSVLEANQRFAESFDQGDLEIPPARNIVVLTCIDARIDPAKVLGLEEGDAHVIRNAGGLVTDDALRSLVISHQLLGTQEVMVIGHTDCGMLKFTNDDLHAKLREETGHDPSHIDFHPFPDGEGSIHLSALTSLPKAWARWLIRCFSAGSISPKVRSWPAGTNIGSYPKPFSPRGGQTSVPSTRPSKPSA